MIVFFACDASTIVPETAQVLDEVMQSGMESNSDGSIWVFHPLFDLNTPYGNSILNKTKEAPPVLTQNPWENIVLKDLWMLKESSLLIYDLDSNPGTHYLMGAVLNRLPIIAVSQTLKGCPPYFSPFVEEIVKPHQLLSKINKLAITPSG